jgi:hypothetical protein
MAASQSIARVDGHVSTPSGSKVTKRENHGEKPQKPRIHLEMDARDIRCVSLRLAGVRIVDL